MPFRHQAARRVDDSLVPVSTPLRCPGPEHTLYSEQQRGVVVDPSVAFNALKRLLEIVPGSFLVGLVAGCPQTNHRPEHCGDRSVSQLSSSVRLLRRGGVVFAGGRLNALTVC